jgi:hypothetical protein
VLHARGGAGLGAAVSFKTHFCVAEIHKQHDRTSQAAKFPFAAGQPPTGTSEHGVGADVGLRVGEHPPTSHFVPTYTHPLNPPHKAGFPFKLAHPLDGTIHFSVGDADGALVGGVGDKEGTRVGLSAHSVSIKQQSEPTLHCLVFPY